MTTWGMVRDESIVCSFFILIVLITWGITYPIEVHTVNITEVQFMNSGIIVWGYWDNSTVEDSEGLFQTGFMPHDVGQVYKIYFREWPDSDIRCLELIKKIKVS